MAVTVDEIIVDLLKQLRLDRREFLTTEDDKAIDVVIRLAENAPIEGGPVAFIPELDDAPMWSCR